MKELNHTYNEKITIIEDNIKLYLNGCSILKLYIAAPSAIATDINNTYNTTMKGNFIDIVNGLKGEFTRSKATELGKLQITNYLNDILTTINNTYNELSDNITSYINTINDNLDVINNTTNNKTLLLRKEVFTKDKLSISYLERKTTAVLESDIKKVSDIITVNDFLNKLSIISDNLSIVDNDSLINTITTIESNRIGIDTYTKYLDTKPYIQDSSLVKTDYKTITDVNTIIFNILDGIKDTTDTSIHELLILLIDKLPIVIENLKGNITTTLDSISKITLSSNTSKYLESINTKAIIPYTDSTVTSSEFDNILKSYSNIVKDSLTLDNNYVSTITDICLILNSKLYVYMYIYSILDKATLNGTLTGNNIKVSG